MKKILLVAGAIIVVLAAGVLVFLRFEQRPAQEQGDPAIAVAVAIGALERTPDHQLAKEQVNAILPLLRVLRDTDPGDAPASQALVEGIRTILAPEQIAAVRRMREEVRAGRQSAQASRRGNPGPGGGFGPGGGPGPGSSRPPRGAASQTEIRQRALARLIQYLESRL